MTTPWQRVFPAKPQTQDEWLAARSRFDEEIRKAEVEGWFKYERAMNNPQTDGSLPSNPAAPCAQSGGGTYILEL